MTSLGGVRHVIPGFFRYTRLSHCCDLPVRFCTPSGSSGGGDLVCCAQPCLRVVSWWYVDIPLVVWRLCFGKLGGVISCLVGPVGGIVGQGHSVPRPTRVSVSSIYAAIVYVLGGLGQSVIFGVILLSYLVSCVSLSMLPLILSLPPLPEDLSPRIMPQDYLA